MASDPLRVLLIDAEVETRSKLKDSLLKHGIGPIDIAESRQQAWELIRQCKDPYQAVLIDEILPESQRGSNTLSGIDLTREIKQYDPRIEIIIFRAKGRSPRLKEALQAGAFRYLEKSDNQEDLAVLIQHAVVQQELEAQARQKPILERLLATNAALLSATTEKEVLDAVWSGIHALNFDRVRLYLLSEDGQTMYGKAQIGMDESFQTIVRSVAEDAHMRDLMEHPRPHVVRRRPGEILPVEGLLDKEDVDEWACLPLLQKGKVLGALSVDNKISRRPILEAELVSVALFASHTAAAIAALTNARLLAETQQQAEQLEALRRTTLAMTSERDLEPLLKTITANAVALLKTKGGGIYKYHEERSVLELIADHNRPHFVGRTLHVGEGMAGKVVQNLAPYMIVDDYQGWDGKADPQRPDVKLFRALLATPLQWQGKVLGVLLLGDDVGRKFTEEDARLLRLFSDQVAISLHNAELLAQDATKLHRLEKLSQATQDIADNLGATTLQERLRLIARHVVDILDAEVSGVLLLQPSSGLLRLEAGHGHREGSREVGKEYRIHSAAGFGLTSHIASEGKPFNLYGDALTHHWASDRHPPDHLPSGERCSLLVIPLKKRVGEEEQLIGLIRAENKKGPDGKPQKTVGFSPEDEWILTIFAEAVVVAIESTQLFQEARAAHARVQTSFQASNTLLSSQTPDKILEDIVEQACVAADADRARVILFDEKGKARVVAGSGAEQYRNADYPVRQDGISLRVMDDGVPRFIEDTGTQPEDVNPILLAEGTKAFCCVPLELREKRIGVMSFYYDAPRDFPVSEVNALQLYASQAAAAYDGIQRLANLEALRHAAENLASADSLPGILRQIAVSARQVLQADVAAIWPYDQEQEQFVAGGMHIDGVHTDISTQMQQEDFRWRHVADAVLAQQWMAVEHRSEVWPATVPDNALWGLMELADSQSFQGVLLTVGDEKLGVLWLLYRQPRHFHDTEKETACTFGNHAALALQQVRLLDQVRKAKRAAEVVTRVTALGGRDVSLESIAEGTREAVGCNAVELCVYGHVINGSQYSPVENPPPILYVTSQEGEITRPQTHVNPQLLVSGLLNYDKCTILPNHTEGVTDEFRQASLVVIPLQVAEQKLGVMLLHYAKRRLLASTNTLDLEQFAQQAAVAIHNAQLYAQARKHAAALQALYEAGQAVTGSLDEPGILKQIARQTWNLLHRQGSAMVTADIWLQDGMTARFVAGYPDSIAVDIRKTLRDTIDLRPEYIGKKGIIGRAIRTGQVQRVVRARELEQDQDYIVYHPNVCSELVVPIKASEEVLGVINVESAEENAFDADDERVLVSLAAQASIAIQHARQYEELRRTKGIVGASTAVAWMGMARATWHHTIRNYAVSIRDHVYMLREDLEAKKPAATLAAQLHDIDTIAENILEAPIPAPLSMEEGVSSVSLNEIIEERMKRLWSREPYASVRVRLALSSEMTFTVRANPAWLTRAFDILLDNALEAMDGCARRELVVATRTVESRVEIAISDTGAGIPSAVLAQLLQQPITKPQGAPGSGIGLLLAQTIVQTYGGDIYLGSTSPEGTTMVLWLPWEGVTPAVGMRPGARSVVLINDGQERAWSYVLQEALSSLASLTVISEDKACESIMQKSYDMILIDETGLPDVLSLITRIRHQRPNAKIIVGAAMPDWRMTRDILEAGVLDYLNKAKSAQELRSTFIEILEAHPAPVALI